MNSADTEYCHVTEKIRLLKQKTGELEPPVELSRRSGDAMPVRAIRDVSAVGEAEKSPEDSELKYRTLFEAIDDPLFIFENYTCIDCNPAVLKIVACEREQVIGKSLWNFSPSFQDDGRDSREKATEKIDAAVCSGPQSFDWKMLGANGNVFDADVSLIRIQFGDRMCVLCIARDMTERKRIENALKESEQKYRAIFENTGTPLLFAEEDTTISLMNKELEKVLGYPRTEIEGKRKWTEFIGNKDDLDRMTEYNRLRRVGPSAAPICYEFQAVTGRGRVRDMVVTVSLLPDKNQTLAALMDVTERKKAEQSLKESEEALRTIFENVHDAIFVHDLQGRVLDANRRMLDLYGVTKEEAARMSIAEDFSTANNPLEDLTDRWTRVLQGEPITFEWEAKRPHDGLKFDVEVALERIHLRNQDVVLANVRDISIRKATEMMLRENEAKFRLLTEHSTDSIMRLDKNHRHLYVNPVVKQQSGILREEFIGKTHEEMGFPKELCALWSGAIDDVFQSGETRRIEFQLPNGIWIDWMLIPELDHPGQVASVIASGRDITERKRAEEEKARLEDQIVHSQKMQAIGQLAGGVAHDFNNIITVILGFGALAQMALRNGQPVRREYIDQILESAHKAANLTQSLLAFSRKQQIKLEPRNLNDIVATTGKLLKRLLTEDIDLKITCHPKDLVVLADPTQIDQILINLVANARDAMPKGGSLTLETSAASIDDEFRRMHGYGKSGNYAVLSVSDTGVGMDEATKKRIFEPFFTTKELGRGTGLGLATAYGIVKQHSGYINVHTGPFLGATFRIYLPLAGMDVRSEELQASQEIKGGTETILVVEDEPSVRNLITMTLRYYGYTTLEATNGVEGVRQFQENRDRIDLVLLDVVMPNMNGKEAYEEISKTRPGTKVIFMSGYTKDVLTQKGVEAKGAKYISKPLSSRVLLDKVRQVLDE